MLAKLFALFTIVPLIELLVLIPLGQQIGLWPTVALVVVTATLGAILGKRQGLEAWRRIQDDLATGRMPGDSLLDGLAILLACTLLVTPGVITDIIGLLLLTPIARRPLKAWIKRRFTNMLQNSDVTVIDVTHFHASQSPRDSGVIDITPDEEPASRHISSVENW